MSYNKLILKTIAAIEIENTIAYYALINKVLAKKSKKKYDLALMQLLKILKVTSAVILKSEYFG